MARKDDVKKMTAKASKPGKAVKTEKSTAKALPKVQKKPALSRAKGVATFRLEAPSATQVFIVGCFNAWDPTANPLRRDDKGAWSCTLVVEPGEHEYRFLVDGVWWDDPASMSRRWNVFGTQNCTIIV